MNKIKDPFLLIGIIIQIAFLFSYYIYSFESSLRYDAVHYLDIATNGYLFELCTQVNVAFFPALPFLIQLFQLQIAYVILFNVFIFLCSYYLLYQWIENKWVLLVCSLLPSTIYFHVLYTESLFFFFTLLFLIGLRKDYKILIISSLLMVGLTRPVITVFTPGLVIVSLYYLLIIKDKQLSLSYFVYSLIPIISLLIVVFIQYQETGVWFATFKSQACWDHHLQLKYFPSISWGANFVQTYDVIIASLGFSTILFTIYYSIQLISRRITLEYTGIELLSILYICGFTLMMFLFQHDWHSLNRYILCSPFAFIAIDLLTKQTTKKIVLFLVLSFIFSSLIDGYLHISILLKNLIIHLGMFGLVFLLKNYSRKPYYIYILILISIGLVILKYLSLNFFLENNWIG